MKSLAALVLGLSALSFSQSLTVGSAPQAMPAPVINEADTKTYVYIHPFMLGVTAAIDTVPLALYVTVEKPFNPGSALVVQPAVLTGEWEVTGHFDDQTTYKRFQVILALGYRAYIGQKNSGWYAQPTLIGSYLDYENIYEDESLQANGAVAAFMAYAGYASHGDVAVYIDAGIGYGIGDVTEANSEGRELSASLSSVVYDINLGFGFGF